MGNNQIILNKVPVLLSGIAPLLLCVCFCLCVRRMCMCAWFCVWRMSACLWFYVCDVCAQFPASSKTFLLLWTRDDCMWQKCTVTCTIKQFHLSGTQMFQFCWNLQVIWMLWPFPSSRSLKWVRPQDHCDTFERFLISCKHKQKWKILVINHMMSYLNRKSWSKVSKYAKIWITPQ